MDAGAWVVAGSTGVALATAMLLRTRAPAWLVVVLLGAAGAGMGWGGMLLRPHASRGEFAAAVLALAILVPAHVRIVIGPFGPGARGVPWRAAVTTEELGRRSGGE
jgi:hypothetical protein